MLPMEPTEPFTAEPYAALALLGTPLLVQIYRALHDLKDGELHEQIANIFWERLGKPADEWPEDVHNPGIVRYCSRADSHKDPRHRLLRTLSGEFNGMECSCGARDLRHRSYKDPATLHLKKRQRIGSALVWPTTIVNGIPHFVVCRYAACADDPNHAPDTFLDQCICGGYFEASSPDKLLPAY